MLLRFLLIWDQQYWTFVGRFSYTTRSAAATAASAVVSPFFLSKNVDFVNITRSAPSISSTVAGGPSTLSAQGPLATVPLGPDPDTELRLSKGGLAAIILSVFLVVICGVVLFLYWRRKQRLRGGLPLVSPATRAAKKQPYSTLGSESTLVVNFEANKSRTLSQCTKTGIGDEDAPLSRTDFLKRERDRINQQLEMLEGRCSSDEPDPLKEIGEDNILFQINALKDKIQALEARQRLRHSSSHHHHHHAHSHSKSPFDSPPEYDSSPQHNPHSIYGQQPLPREDKTQCFCGSCN